MLLEYGQYTSRLGLRVFVIALSLFVIAGCGTQFAYNNVSWFVSWRVDDFVELSNQQEKQMDLVVEDFMRWHRTVELPRYAALLDEFKLAIETKNKTLFSEVFDRSTSLYKSSAEQIAPRLSMLLSQLTNSQKQQLFNNIEKWQQEQKEDWQENEAEILEERVERQWRRYEDYLGDIEPNQTQMLESIISKLQYSYEYRFESQSRWLDLFKDALPVDNPIVMIKIENLITDVNSYRVEGLQAQYDSNRQVMKNGMLQLLPTLSQKQQDHLTDEIDQYLIDIDELTEQS